ncbi:hypothetical protein BDV12DRAFT_122471 [Aspergillus spectabilis]
MTSLHVAVKLGTEPMVQAMIAHAAEVNAGSVDSDSLLLCAARKETDLLLIMQLLLKSGAVITTQGNKQQEQFSLLMRAALNFFGPEFPIDEERLSVGFSLPQSGRLMESVSVKEVLSTGPGAVIKFLLLSQQKIRATETRLSLLFQMLTVTGDSPLPNY